MTVSGVERWVDFRQSRVIRSGILIYLAAVTVYVSLRYAVLYPDGGHVWATGDWLIHYGAGFVRRGLTGWITFQLSDWTGVNITLVAMTTQTIIYVIMMGLVIYLLSRLTMTGPVMMLAVSPVVLLMPFYNLKLAMCKEMIGYLGLALIAAMAFTERRWMLWAGIVVLGISGFAQEINAFLAPSALVFVLIYRFTGLIGKRTAILAAALTVVPAAASVLVAMAFPGYGLSDEVCRQLLARGAAEMFCIDLAPVWWLDRSIADGMAFTWKVNVATGVWPWFILGFVLSMVPFCFFRVVGDRTGRATALVLAAAGLGLVIFAPLFVVASDWGRWISMHVFALAMLTFAALRLGLIEERTTSVHPAFLLYGVVWSMVDFGEPLNAGFLMKGWSLVRHSGRPDLTARASFTPSPTITDGPFFRKPGCGEDLGQRVSHPRRHVASAAGHHASPIADQPGHLGGVTTQRLLHVVGSRPARDGRDPGRRSPRGVPGKVQPLLEVAIKNKAPAAFMKLPCVSNRSA